MGWCFPVVRFRVVRGEPQGFLDAVRREGLPLRRFGRGADGMAGEIPLRHYRRLACLARENGAVLRVSERRGVWFRLRRYRKRLGLAAGAALFLGVTVFGQSFLWAIDVVPTENVTEQQVLDVLARHGVAIGAYLPGTDLEEAALLAKLELPGLAFFALNRVGSRIQVEMADSVDPPEDRNPDGICNVVASRSGIIRSVEAYSGQQMVKPGQSVAAGMLLVSGIIENRDGNMLYVHADAKVMAETEVSRTFSIPLSYTEREMTGETETRYRLDLFGKKWPLFLAAPEKSPCESERVLYEPQLGPFTLPVGVERETLSYYRESERERTEEEALLLLRQMAEEYGEELEKSGAQLLSAEESARTEGGKMELTAVYTLLEDIAKPQPIRTGETLRKTEENQGTLQRAEDGGRQLG